MARPRRADGPRRIAIVINLTDAYKWHQEVFAGAYGYARKRGWRVDAMSFSRQLGSLGRMATPCDGIIARADRRLAAFAAARRIPLVNVWYSSPVRSVPHVVPDLLRVGQLAAEHLAARGFRRFAFAGAERTRSSLDEERGFREAVDVGGEWCERLLTPVDALDSAKTFIPLERALSTWLRRLPKPVGVFAYSDVLARHLVNAAIALGISVPEDMAVVGAYNEDVFCTSCEPTLTSIDLGCHRIGAAAARQLESLMDGGETPSSRVYISPVGLIPRDSTDVFSCDDVLVGRALRYISENCHRPINVADVARSLRVSGRTLARHFRQARGCRVIDELARMRITRAKRLLVETGVPIRKVAEQCGFAGSSQFTTAFRRLAAATPSEFRKRG